MRRDAQAMLFDAKSVAKVDIARCPFGQQTATAKSTPVAPEATGICSSCGNGVTDRGQRDFTMRLPRPCGGPMLDQGVKQSRARHWNIRAAVKQTFHSRAARAAAPCPRTPARDEGTPALRVAQSLRPLTSPTRGGRGRLAEIAAEYPCKFVIDYVKLLYRHSRKNQITLRNVECLFALSHPTPRYTA